jgi:GAF domain-containing protein
MSAHDVRKALHDLGDLRYAAGDLDDALRRIVGATHQLFAVDGAGLMLIDPDQLLRSVADSDERIGHLEELQIDHGEGPCIDAFDDKELIHAADLGSEKRWPAFSPAAVDRGLRAVLASPIPYNQMAIGVVTVFSTRVHPWSPEGALVARDGVSPGEAFEQMRRRARAERRRVVEIAREIMITARHS